MTCQLLMFRAELAKWPLVSAEVVAKMLPWARTRSRMGRVSQTWAVLTCGHGDGNGGCHHGGHGHDGGHSSRNCCGAGAFQDKVGPNRNVPLLGRLADGSKGMTETSLTRLKIMPSVHDTIKNNADLTGGFREQRG